MTGVRGGRGGAWLAAAAVAAFSAVALVVLATLVAVALSPEDRAAVGDAVTGQLPLLVVGGGLVLAGLAAVVARLVERHSGAVRRLAAETRLLVETNPDHVPSREGPEEVAALADAVALLAERRRAAEREVSARVAAAQATLEQERNQLAALMGELAVAVLVCNDEGRILLYNTAARALVADDAAIGIGRDVYAVVDRALVDHSLARVRAGAGGSHTATAVHRGRVLEVQVTPVPGRAGGFSGFVLLLQDLTDRMVVGEQRAASVRVLTEAARARLGTIRAAMESVLGHPEMSPEERLQFLGIVDEESRLLGGEVTTWAAARAELFGSEWPMADIAAGDLLSLVREALSEAEPEAEVVVTSPPAGLWLKVDSHAVVRAAGHLVAHLVDRWVTEEAVPDLHVVLGMERLGTHAQLEVSWAGPAVPPDQLASWLDEPLAGSGAATVREVVAGHAGEVWSGSVGGAAHLRMLLPLAVTPSRPPDAVPTGEDPATVAGSRPEFYDFDLFTRRDVAPDVQQQPLGDLAYTVLDTETTGLDPLGGDEIIAIGAVRVVNGRLLRRECFEQLLDPQRDVPAASTAVHGLTSSMLAGSPTVDDVLPELARYAADTVLVGHNVGFDLQFLRMLEGRTGVVLRQPALDTLLLDAVVHPDHEEHSLEAIAGRLGVPVTGRHSALGDALVTAEVFLRLLPLLEARGLHTLGEALAACQATLQARLDQRMYGP